MSDLWSITGDQAEADIKSHLVEAALIEAAPYRSIAAKAADTADFQNRLTIIDEKLDKVIAKVVESTDDNFAYVKSEVVREFRLAFNANRTKVQAEAKRKSLLQREVVAGLNKVATERTIAETYRDVDIYVDEHGEHSFSIGWPGKSYGYMSNAWEARQIIDFEIDNLGTEASRKTADKPFVYMSSDVICKVCGVNVGPWSSLPKTYGDNCCPNCGAGSMAMGLEDVTWAQDGIFGSRKTAYQSANTNKQRRGHEFQMPQDIQRNIPKTYGTDDIAIADKIVHAHYFSPSGDWYVVEMDDDGYAWGFADLGYGEWGYFDLEELEEVYVEPFGIVERDMHFSPKPVSEIAKIRTGMKRAKKVQQRLAALRGKTAGIGPVMREGRECDARMLLQQIGNMNVMAISGGRTEGVYNSSGQTVGVNLPVSNGYSVVVYLDASDTYVVERCYRDNVKGSVDYVYGDNVGEIAYRASCFKDAFGGHLSSKRKTARGHADTYYMNGKWYHATGWDLGPFGVVESDGDYGVVYEFPDEDGDETYDIVVNMSRFDAEDSVERWAANPQTAPFDDTWTNDWSGLLDNVKGSRKAAKRKIANYEVGTRVTNISNGNSATIVDVYDDEGMVDYEVKWDVDGEWGGNTTWVDLSQSHWKVGSRKEASRCADCDADGELNSDGICRDCAAFNDGFNNSSEFGDL